MEANSWWLSHLWVMLIQIVAFVPYAVGSRKFYVRQAGAMRYIGIGILLDIFMAVAASSGVLPRMSDGQGAPWYSALFIIHFVTAGIGMFGFIALYIFVLSKGQTRPFPRLRSFQYRVLLPLWCFGVCIAFANFVVKVAFHVRIYDLF